MTAIDEIERDVDRAFGANALKDESFAQATWTLLSQTEDAYIKILHQARHEEELRIFVDIRLNALTYPMRVCYRECPPHSLGFDAKYVEEHYKLAWDWLKVADHDYFNFSSIFPLWRRGKVLVEASDGAMRVVRVTPEDAAYEAYNRLVPKDARPEPLLRLNGELVALLFAHTTHGRDWFRVNFNPKLVAHLVSVMRPVLESRHMLPAAWNFAGFSLEEYRRALFTLQAMLWAWTVVRNELAANGMPGLGYSSAVWVVPATEMKSRLRRYTGIRTDALEKILSLITFGSSGVRDPDVATQPLVDLRNGCFALSPFVWLNINAERNLCVLLNQIPEQRNIYERLKNEKERLLREEMRSFLVPLGFDVRTGELDGTDVDIAIIDRAGRVCLCLELKWFIEPAEIREVREKTRELSTGVSQAKRIDALHQRRDGRLDTLLQIDDGYLFRAAVASHNWIGHADAQDDGVPIIKVWHLLNKIRDTGSLLEACDWMFDRGYLPKEGVDFAIVPIEISCGSWRCEWYGIKPLAIEEAEPKEAGS